MRRLALLVVSVALACGAGSSVSRAGGPFGSIKVGTWHGGAYTDKDGAFEHCTATNLLPAPGPCWLPARQAARAPFAVTNPAWHLRSGRSMSLVDAAFDGEAPLHFQAVVASAHEVGLVVAPAAAAERLSKARTMTFVIGGQSYDFAVDTVGQVLPVLDACVARVKSAGIANVGTFSVPPGKPGEPKAGTDAAPAPAAGPKEAAAKPAASRSRSMSSRRSEGGRSMSAARDLSSAPAGMWSPTIT